MNAIGGRFWSDLRQQLYLEPRQEQEILDELEAHIEDRVDELVEAGNTRAEAQTRALDEFGARRSIGEQLYAVHHTVSWHQTMLAVLPHVLLALMFAFGLWRAHAWVVLLMVAATVISIFGWSKGRPNWTYPWLGYCLVAPIVSWGLAMSAVVYGAWRIVTAGSLPLSFPLYMVCLGYIAFSMWAVVRIVSRLVRRDWLMASLAVLPFPFVAYWYIYFFERIDAQETVRELQGVDASAAAVFLMLAGTTAIFFRVGRRLLKVAILTITGPSMIVLAWLSYQGGPGFFAGFLFAAASLTVLLGPLLLHRRRRVRADAVGLAEETA